ncbi:NUDIX domain-containing protein [Ktedonosporobacter rubrisoli]|uniref:NUDIX domain-containing protein n=1 Tax=Ktedonosporobacter rubrisoli TaxID=2509675 RepID=A0A4P6JKN4_KTERU|nr:NUDIX domain-containing protein [Ktedonosporobacter rubrisoli]QBD75532.1 NUDIX domain-containing protein [Ktedonosporobacter rubrisoli]
MHTIHTVGLAIFQDARLLLVRKRNTMKFMLPGGKIDPGESETECIVREIYEELQSHVQLETLRFLGNYTDLAANELDAMVTMKLYTGQITNPPQPSREIEEIYWFDRGQHNGGISIAPLLDNQILPYLIATHYLS